MRENRTSSALWDCRIEEALRWEMQDQQSHSDCKDSPTIVKRMGSHTYPALAATVVGLAVAMTVVVRERVMFSMLVAFTNESPARWEIKLPIPIQNAITKPAAKPEIAPYKKQKINKGNNCGEHTRKLKLT